MNKKIVAVVLIGTIISIIGLALIGIAIRLQMNLDNVLYIQRTVPKAPELPEGFVTEAHQRIITFATLGVLTALAGILSIILYFKKGYPVAHILGLTAFVTLLVCDFLGLRKSNKALLVCQDVRFISSLRCT